MLSSITITGNTVTEEWKLEKELSHAKASIRKIAEELAHANMLAKDRDDDKHALDTMSVATSCSSGQLLLEDFDTEHGGNAVTEEWTLAQSGKGKGDTGDKDNKGNQRMRKPSMGNNAKKGSKGRKRSSHLS